MKKINFKEVKVTDLKGNELHDLKVHESVGNILASRSTDKPIRSMELARKIFLDGEIELPSEDVLLIRNAILENRQITDLLKSAILKALE